VQGRSRLFRRAFHDGDGLAAPRLLRGSQGPRPRVLDRPWPVKELGGRGQVALARTIRFTPYG
jgi:hypothetical protein